MGAISERGQKAMEREQELQEKEENIVSELEHECSPMLLTSVLVRLSWRQSSSA
jgi:hypothetical protein